MNRRTLSLVIPALATIVGCSADSGVSDVPAVTPRDHECEVTEIMELTPDPYGAFCPYAPDGVGPITAGVLTGDRDFWGHGPQITIEVELRPTSGNRYLEAVLSYTAQETEGGDTRIVDSDRRVVWGPAPDGFEIDSILSDTTSTISVLSPGAGWEIPGGCNDGVAIAVGPASITGTLVASADLIGDTGANDVSGDTDCTCDTRVDDIVFNDVVVGLREVESCQPHPEPTTTGGGGGSCGEECEVDEDCSGTPCVDGVCGSACEPDKPCNVPGKFGECRPGRTECNECETMCIAENAATEEVCDGLDNDCDGDIDEDIAAEPCEDSPPGCGELTFGGQTVCSGGTIFCAQQPGVDYCTGCDGGPCGFCGGCIPSANACAPNAYCGGEAGFEQCHVDPTCSQPVPQCYLPSDVKLPPNHCYGS